MFPLFYEKARVGRSLRERAETKATRCKIIVQGDWGRGRKSRKGEHLSASPAEFTVKKIEPRPAWTLPGGPAAFAALVIHVKTNEERVRRRSMGHSKGGRHLRWSFVYFQVKHEQLEIRGCPSEPPLDCPKHVCLCCTRKSKVREAYRAKCHMCFHRGKIF